MLPLRIRIHAELPQWITSSDRAAYHPATRTIHIKRSCLSVRVVLHELCHWFIHCAGLPERFHRALDHHSPSGGIMPEDVEQLIESLQAMGAENMRLRYALNRIATETHTRLYMQDIAREALKR